MRYKYPRKRWSRQKQEKRFSFDAAKIPGAILAVAIFIIVAIALTAGSGSKATSEVHYRDQKTTSLGSKGQLVTPGQDLTYLCISENVFDKWVKAAVANDFIGMNNLVSSGQVFSVPNYTRALVIDRGFARRLVRILDGDAAGRTGWVPMEFFR